MISQDLGGYEFQRISTMILTMLKTVLRRSGFSGSVSSTDCAKNANCLADHTFVAKLLVSLYFQYSVGLYNLNIRGFWTISI